MLCRKLSLFLFKYWGNRACYLVEDLCKWLFVSHDWALQSVSYIDNVIMPLLPFQSSTSWRSLPFLYRVGLENPVLFKSTFIPQQEKMVELDYRTACSGVVDLFSLEPKISFVLGFWSAYYCTS